MAAPTFPAPVEPAAGDGLNPPPPAAAAPDADGGAELGEKRPPPAMAASASADGEGRLVPAVEAELMRVALGDAAEVARLAPGDAALPTPPAPPATLMPGRAAVGAATPPPPPPPLPAAVDAAGMAAGDAVVTGDRASGGDPFAPLGGEMDASPTAASSMATGCWMCGRRRRGAAGAETNNPPCSVSCTHCLCSFPTTTAYASCWIAGVSAYALLTLSLTLSSPPLPATTGYTRGGASSRPR